MKVSNKQLVKNLVEVLKDTPEKDISTVLQNFVQLLYKRRKFSQIDQILAEYEKYIQEQDGEMRVEVTTVNGLHSEIKQTLQKQFGQNIKIVETTDKNILGGIILKTNNTIYDASVRATLHQLKQSL